MANVTSSPNMHFLNTIVHSMLFEQQANDQIFYTHYTNQVVECKRVLSASIFNST